MLKYSDRITKLTDGQKIRILTTLGSISGKDMKNLGIPTIKMGNMKGYERQVYPHTTSISHAWNAGLWRDVAVAKIARMAEDDVRFAVAPGAKIKLSPYRKETTEDPYLASLLSGTYMKAAADAGMTVAASGYYVTECDALWMDETPNERILNEYVVRPYVRAKDMAPTSGIVTDVRVPGESYKGCCPYIQRLVVGQTEFLVCENATDDNTVSLIANGILCLQGSANALSAALSKHRKIKKQIEEGRDITILQLEEAVKKGEAISDETVDEAVDRALDFLFRCNEKPRVEALTEEQADALALRATLESTVLLKNKNAILPLLKQSRVLLIDAFADHEASGDLAKTCAAQLAASGFDRVETERFVVEDEVQGVQHRIDRLFSYSYNADVTVLLLGSGYETEKQMHRTEKLTLPPSQLYLAEQVAKRARRVVTVILSEHGTDVEFARPFEGVILAPLPTRASGKALAQILCGQYNPSGRLAYTLYAGSETSLQKGMAYLRKKGLKSGPFVGYRYYDTADLRVGYPFGHGLSYTEFMYYGLEVTKDTVSFTVQNCTRVAGSEVAQVYAGLNGSAVLRPKKELCGFAKVDLGPWERKRITLKLELPTVYADGEFVLEKGTYCVYVGASVSDIRLTGSVDAGEATLTPDGARLSDYLQSHSNILNDNYTLEANYSVMKKGLTNIIAGVVSLALAISLAVFNITTHAASMAIGIISGILALGSIVFFIVEMVERSRLHAESRKSIQKANEVLFEEAEQIPILSTDKMFAEAFDVEDDEEDEIPHHGMDAEDEFDYSEYIDAKFLLRDAVAEFNRFAAERGYKMERGVTENLFASFSVSKLMILGGLSAEQFNEFALLLSEYFGCTACLDNADATQTGSTSLFFDRDAEGYGTKKNIFKALAGAAEDHSKVSLSAIDDLTAENATEWLSPVMRYVRSPKKKNTVVMRDQHGEKLAYTIGANLWVLVRLSDYDAVDMLPIETVKCAPVVNVSFVKCPMSEDPSVSHGFSAYQVDYMRTQAAGKYEVSEETWKKIDKIERYGKQYGDYSIGNKLWLDLEKQMELLLACELTLEEAADVALATKILPSLSVALKDKLGEEDKTILQTVEFVFGVDHTDYAKTYIDSLTVKEREPEPVAEEAVAEEAVAEEAVAEEAATEEAATEEAATEEEATEEAATEEAATEEEAAEEEATEEEAAEEEAAEEEVAEEEAAEEEAAEEEVAEEEVAEEETASEEEKTE